MADEAKAEEQVIESEAVEQSPDEQPTEQVEQEQEAPEVPAEEAPAEEEAVEEEPPKPSRRESLRIQQLVQKLRQKEQAPAPKTQRPDGLDYRTELDADDEVISKLDADRQAYGDSQYQRGIKQAESIQFHTRLEIDAPKVESKYPFLNREDQENFNPVAASAINEWYLATVDYDPKTGSVGRADVRYADFVDGLMELANELADNKVATVTKNIVKQAANTGLRPDGSSAKRLNLNKAPEQMSDEELDAVIALGIPPKK